MNYAIIEHLKGQVEDHPALSGAIATLEAELGVDSTSATSFSELSYFPTPLVKIFDAGVSSLGCKPAGENFAGVEGDPKFDTFSDAVKAKGFYNGVEEGSVEYLQRQAKLVAKYNEKRKAPVQNSEELEAKAEEKKGLGNNAMVAKDYDSAISYYNEALDLSPAGPNSHVYYSNRAAAHCHKSNYKEAISDCEASLALEPTYVKALSRLGLANYWDGNYEASAAAYEKALEYDPDNKATQDSLLKAQNKLRKIAASSASAGGMPDMSALAGMMGGGGGGGGGLADMMKNPAMMSMAQKMMKDPSMMAKAQEMMKNPAMMQQAMQMMGGGGGGGMPDMSALAGMMGGGAPSSSGSG